MTASRWDLFLDEEIKGLCEAMGAAAGEGAFGGPSDMKMWREVWAVAQARGIEGEGWAWTDPEAFA